VDATGMIAFTGLVVSSVLLAVQFAAGQYSPRLVLWFRRDQLVRHAIGSFLAASVFALVALHAIEDRPASFSPDITVIGGFALLVGAAVLFLLLLQRVLDGLRPRAPYAGVARVGIHAVRAVYPLGLAEPDPLSRNGEHWRSPAPRELPVRHGAGVVTSCDASVLLAAAELASRNLEASFAVDARGVPCLVWRTPDWSDLMDLAFEDIREYGAGSVQVMRRLRAALEDLRAATPVQRHDAIERHVASLDETARRACPAGTAEESVAARADRTGPGMARCT